MSNKYFSVIYKGFLIEQTEKGWVIPQIPNWANFGPVSKAPYSTRYIAQNVIDLVLNHSKGI